jgi:hypothetical protein
MANLAGKFARGDFHGGGGKAGEIFDRIYRIMRKDFDMRNMKDLNEIMLRL